MYKIILVPLDGSKRAEAIMPQVEEMAHRYGATVILMQVVEHDYRLLATNGSFAYEVFESDFKQRKEKAQAYLVGWQGIMREKGIHSKATITHGPIVQTILEVAKHEEADIIAMSSHGRTGLGRAFYGSVAAGVLHQTSLPLLLVRALHGD